MFFIVIVALFDSILTHNTFIPFIFSHFDGYEIYLNIQLFGYEELLYELASRGVKIQLTTSQKMLFERNGHGHLFKFNEPPDIKVFASDITENVFSWEQYEK